MVIRVSEGSILLGLAFGLIGSLITAVTRLLVRIPLLGWLGIAAGAAVAVLGASVDLTFWTAIGATLGLWGGRWAHDARTGGPTLSERYLERIARPRY